MSRKKLIDLYADRTALLAQADAASQGGDSAGFDDVMQQIENINNAIRTEQRAAIEESERAIANVPTGAEARDMAEERAEQLRNHGSITFSNAEVMRALRNSTVVAGTIAQPTGAGEFIADNLGRSTLIELVSTMDMTGLGGWDEPYASAEQTAYVGAPSSTGGTARTASDPTFAISQIKPYEVSVTSFVDRNIARLSPAAYLQKVQMLAMDALRKKISALILLGDTESTHVMYGMQNGTNKAGSSIVASYTCKVDSDGKGVVDDETLNDLYFAYGNNYETGPDARLFCNKTDLAALGAIRGTYEKRRVFAIEPDRGFANRGIISDGGLIVPYLLDPNLTAINGTAQAAVSGADKLCAVYGDPRNYLLGLFGGYTIRVDESVKAVERMFAILGDAVIGGNVVVDKGFVVAKIPKAAS